MVITPTSPQGKMLLGCVTGDEVQGVDSGRGTVYTVVGRSSIGATDPIDFAKGAVERPLLFDRRTAT